jgi:hypothetical protein
MDDFANQVIELENVEAVKRWCAIFGCNEADLIHAVYRVGPSAAEVYDYLGRTTDRARGLGSRGAGEH